MKPIDPDPISLERRFVAVAAEALLPGCGLPLLSLTAVGPALAFSIRALARRLPASVDGWRLRRPAAAAHRA